MVYHNRGVLDHVSRFASHRQVLVVPPSQSTKILRTKLARTACPCGGRLHCRQLPPEAAGHCPPSFPSDQCIRLSFCCDRDGCRKRTTPPSVRFLGRKVYLGAIVILISAMRQGPSPRRVRELSARFGADRRTIARWQVFWREHFPQTPFWKIARARSGARRRDHHACPTRSSTPSSRRHRIREGWTLLLRFLSPITIPGGLRIEVSRCRSRPAEDARRHLGSAGL